jgi:hypothetical protein
MPVSLGKGGSFVASRGSQLTLPGLVTIKTMSKSVNIGAGACPRARARAGACHAGAGAGGAVAGAKRWRDDNEADDFDDDDGNDNDADAVANANAVEDKATAYFAMMSLKAKRVCYTSEQKQAILAVYHSVNQNQVAALRIVRKKSGYEKVGRKHIYRWLRDLRAGARATARRGARARRTWATATPPSAAARRRCACGRAPSASSRAAASCCSTSSSRARRATRAATGCRASSTATRTKPKDCRRAPSTEATSTAPAVPARASSIATSTCGGKDGERGGGMGTRARARAVLTPRNTPRPAQAALNILKLLIAWLRGELRPHHLLRDSAPRCPARITIAPASRGYGRCAARG